MTTVRVLIEDGPHAGARDIPRTAGEVLELASPGTDALRPATRQRYRRQHPHPHDFMNGLDARYRWEP